MSWPKSFSHCNTSTWVSTYCLGPNHFLTVRHFYLGQHLMSWPKSFSHSIIPDNTQLWVHYTQISVLMHRCEACASCWHTHIFSEGDDRQQVGKECKVQKAIPGLPNQIPIHSADWLKCRFQNFCHLSSIINLVGDPKLLAHAKQYQKTCICCHSSNSS